MLRIALHALWIGTALRILLPSAVDPDLWGHTLFGRLLLAGAIPTTNGFAYTAAQHPWLNHELLAEGAMAAAFDALGAAGLVALKTLLGLATLAIVWRTARRRSESTAAASVATAATALVMAPGFMIRPQLFTFLFLALTLEVLAGHDYRPRGAAWLLPLLVVLWVNTHGGVLAGVGLTAAAIVGALVSRIKSGAAAARELTKTLLFLGTLAVGLLVNPYGPDLLRFLATEVTPHVPISEWRAIPLTDLSFPAFKAMLVVVAVWLVCSRHARLPEAMMLALAGAEALLHRRHIPLFAIAAGPVLAALLSDVWTRLGRRWDLQPAVSPLRAGAVAVAALQVTLAIVTGLKTRDRIEVDPRTYPVQALRFLSENAVAGNVALPFNWGEYGLWSLPPGSQVAVDGRFTTAYPRALLDQAWRFMSGGPGWDAILTRYPTEIVLASRRQAPARLLRNHPEWEYVYSDPVSLVFIRKTSTQAATLARFHAGSFRYDRSPLDTAFPAAPREVGLAVGGTTAGGDTIAQADATSATFGRAWTP